MQTIPNSNQPFLTYVPAGSVDKTRYLFFATAGGTTGNTGSLWYDESGNNYHATAPDPDDVFVKTVDGAGKTVLRASAATGGFLRLGTPAQPASDYTIYAVVRPDSAQAPYLLDTAGHLLILGFNTGDTGAYFANTQPHGQGALSLAAGELALICWRLSATEGGRVYKNGVLVYSGDYFASALPASPALGHDVNTYYAAFTGDILSLVLRAGSDTDADVAQAQSYLANQAGISL